MPGKEEDLDEEKSKEGGLGMASLFSQHAGAARLLLLKGGQSPAHSSASHRPDRKGLRSGSPRGRRLVRESNSDLQSAGGSHGDFVGPQGRLLSGPC